MALDGTYAGLTASIADWLDRSDLTTQIPDFVVVFEAKASRVIRHPQMLTRDDAFTVDSQYETVPTGFVAPKVIVLNTTPVTKLEYITPEKMAEYRAGYSTSGKPEFYTVSGGNFEFFPTPGEGYTASVLYYARLDGLATTDPNWLLTSHPDVYLYGALCAAEPFIGNDERLPVWKSLLSEALLELRIEGDSMALASGAAVRPPAIG